MKKIFILSAIITSIVLYACKHTPPENTPGTGGGTGGGGTGGGGTGGGGSNTICFQSQILPIFVNNCLHSGCHNSTDRREGYVFDSYNNIMNSGDGDAIEPFDLDDSEAYDEIIDNKMPKSPYPKLTAEQKNLIGQWILQGAQNTTNCGTTCNPAQFTYSANVKPIFQNACIQCHSGSSAAGALDLTDYSQTYTKRNKIVDRTQRDPSDPLKMPKGLANLSDCEKTVIQKWVQAGAPNN